jgi:hypothetical protein
MRGFLERHAIALQSAGAIATAVAAVTALIVVPWQLRAADRLQQAQSARDIYRDFLNLTVQRPELAVFDTCAATPAPFKVAYEAYVDHLLYTAEQTLAVSADWGPVMQGQIKRHMPWLCTWDEAEIAAFSDPLADLLRQQRLTCDTVPACP